MARGPFLDDALTRYAEVQDANQRLLVSLEELRSRADKFLAVAASTATVFAAFANGSHPDRSQMDRYQGPVEDRGGTTVIDEPVVGPPTIDPPSVGSTRTRATPWSDPSPAEVVRPQGTEHEGCGREVVVAQAITSPNRTNTTAGTSFSFTVTTTGRTVPFITVKNDLPLHLRFHDNGDGTADIFGTARKAGIFHFKIRARFGRDTGKYVVTQGFTLNVVGDS